MRTALPEHVSAPRMTFQARRILLCDGVVRILAETDRNRFLSSSRFHMRASWSMAGFATAAFQRIPRVLHYFPHDGVLEAALLILVACDAYVTTYIVPICSRGRHRCGLLLSGRGCCLLGSLTRSGWNSECQKRKTSGNDQRTGCRRLAKVHRQFSASAIGRIRCMKRNPTIGTLDAGLPTRLGH